MSGVSGEAFGPLAWATNALILAGTIGMLIVFSRPALRGSRAWRATVTPLASIIGSGFLVVAPILGYTVGHWALAAMIGIVVLAYAIGGAVRYNIQHVEAISDVDDNNRTGSEGFTWAERAAELMLALAYVIAITFYLELLAAFVLHLFGIEAQIFQKAIATVLIIFIGAVGFWRGLSKLEMLEKYAVDTKLAIIVGFLLGLVVINIRDLVTDTWTLAVVDVDWSIATIRKLLGAFLIVQGFETSRYMGNVYAAGERIATMRLAQLLSAAIYVVFIALVSILLGTDSSISETGIIELSAQVAFVLPLLLVIGAAAAQFSAAVADTLASGGLVEAASYGKVSHRHVYLVVTAVVLALLWSSHIFAIIAYASRAFAAYYAIQCAMAAAHVAAFGSGSKRVFRTIWFAFLSLCMILTAMFGIPAESVAG